MDRRKAAACKPVLNGMRVKASAVRGAFAPSPLPAVAQHLLGACLLLAHFVSGGSVTIMCNSTTAGDVSRFACLPACLPACNTALRALHG